MIIEITLSAIALIWVLVAVVFDLKTREIPDWLNLSLIATALSMRAFYSVINWDGIYLLQGLFGIFVFFIIAHIFYYSRIFAGGDAKLLIALGAVIVFTENFLVNLDYLIMFSALLITLGAVYGILYSMVIVSKNYLSFTEEFLKQIKTNKKVMISGIILFLILSVTITALSVYNESYYLIFVLPVISLLMPFLFYYSKAFEKACLIKKINTNKLREGDWLYKDLRIKTKNKKIVLIKSNFEGLTKKEINLLKKHKKSVFIKDGIPFVPAFLITLIVYTYIYLRYPNWSLWKVISLLWSF